MSHHDPPRPLNFEDSATWYTKSVWQAVAFHDTHKFGNLPATPYLHSMAEQENLPAISNPQITANNGRFLPGNPGRQPGTKGRLTKTVKETVLAVFNQIQEDPKANLTAFAKKYPRDFYAIAARLIPTEITGTIRQVIRVTDTPDDIEEAEVIPTTDE